MRVIHVHNVMHTPHYIAQDTWAQLGLTLCLRLFKRELFLTLLMRVSSMGNNSRWRKWKKAPWISSFKVKHLPPWHQPVIIGASRVLEINYSLFELPPWDFVPLMENKVLIKGLLFPSEAHDSDKVGRLTSVTRVTRTWQRQTEPSVENIPTCFYFDFIFFSIFHQAAASGALMLKTESVKCLSMRQRPSLGVYLSTSSPSGRLALAGVWRIHDINSHKWTFSTTPVFLLC